MAGHRKKTGIESAMTELEVAGARVGANSSEPQPVWSEVLGDLSTIELRQTAIKTVITWGIRHPGVQTAASVKQTLDGINAIHQQSMARQLDGLSEALYQTLKRLKAGQADSALIEALTDVARSIDRLRRL